MNHEDVDHLHKSSKALDSLFSHIENLPLSKTIENHFKRLINDSSSPNKTLNEYSSTNTKVPTTRPSSVKPSKTVRKTTTKASKSFSSDPRKTSKMPMNKLNEERKQRQEQEGESNSTEEQEDVSETEDDQTADSRSLVI